MHKTELFDHLYFQKEALRGRVVGPFFAGSETTILGRAVLRSGVWKKPVKYATETGDPELWQSLPMSATRVVAGTRLPVMDMASADLLASPFDWQRNERVTPATRELVERLSNFVGGQEIDACGIGGSRLFGSETQESDVDLVLRKESEDLRHRIIGRFPDERRDQATARGLRFRRFEQLYRGVSMRMSRRNVFTALWDGLIVDLMSSVPAALTEADTLDEGNEIISIQSATLRVVDDSMRTSFPVGLLVESPACPGEAVLLRTFDPAAQCCLAGDRLEVTGFVARYAPDRRIVADAVRIAAID